LIGACRNVDNHIDKSKRKTAWDRSKQSMQEVSVQINMIKKQADNDAMEDYAVDDLLFHRIDFGFERSVLVSILVSGTGVPMLCALSS